MRTPHWAVVAMVALCVLLPAQVVAADTHPTPPASVHLQQRANQQSADLQAGVARRQSAADRATAALEAYQAAQRAADAAVRHAQAQTDMLAAAAVRTTQARERLARYVGSLYRTGMGNRRMAVYGNLMDAQNPQQLFRGLSMASRVGANQNDAFSELRRAQQSQARIAGRAQRAAEQARAATAAAAQAKTAADAVVAAAAAAVVSLSAELARTQQALAAAQQRELRMAQASLIARQRSAVPFAAIEGALAPRPIPECEGMPTTGYPNGRLPLTALCPLWGTSGQLLRADAAATFDAMSKEFGAEFGEPICVTDSYRSFGEQLAVADAKPTLAAVPGRSNHGWGVALDLCGGIQSFSTAQHAWLVTNSMAYGWFLPAWAQQDGSRPEPWHWEFAG